MVFYLRSIFTIFYLYPDKRVVLCATLPAVRTVYAFGKRSKNRRNYSENTISFVVWFLLGSFRVDGTGFRIVFIVSVCRRVKGAGTIGRQMSERDVCRPAYTWRTPIKTYALPPDDHLLSTRVSTDKNVVRTARGVSSNREHSSPGKTSI